MSEQLTTKHISVAIRNMNDKSFSKKAYGLKSKLLLPAT